MNKLLTITFAAVLFMTIVAQAADQNEKIVFVTKASFKSDMSGLAGADAKCQAEADDPSSIVPSGTYLPWLSDGHQSPDSRFTKSTHPYMLPDGTKIAENYADLTDGSILHEINVDATGAPVPGSQRFWTDTMPDGKAVQPFVANANSNSCNAWNGIEKTQRVSNVVIGSTIETSGMWSNTHQMSCKYLGKHKYRLACFQQ